MVIGDEEFRDYLGISRAATVASIQCGRIARNDASIIDRGHLRSLGYSIENLCEDSNYEPSNRIIKSRRALGLAKEYSEKYFSQMGGVGDNPLTYLGNLLVQASEPESFDRYAPQLQEMFREWTIQAEHCAVVRKNKLLKKKKRGCF